MSTISNFSFYLKLPGRYEIWNGISPLCMFLLLKMKDNSCLIRLRCSKNRHLDTVIVIWVILCVAYGMFVINQIYSDILKTGHFRPHVCIEH